MRFTAISCSMPAEIFKDWPVQQRLLYGAGTTLTVDGHIDVLAQDGPAGTNRVNGTTLISPAAASPYGGSAYVSAVNGAALSAVGNISVDSNALSLTSGTYPAYSPTTAGFASVSALDGGKSVRPAAP